MTKYYVDQDGNYLGGFDGAEPPADSIEVSSPPAHGLDKFINGVWVPYVPVPQTVTMRQARLALLGAGLLDDVSVAINSLPSPQKEAAQIEWEYSQEVHRNKELVAMLLPALGLTQAQADELFIAAAHL
jgi:hypothetical protein